LRARAFGHYHRCAELLKRFHRARKKINRHAHGVLVGRVRDWLLCPYSLWPVDIRGLAEHLLGRVEKGQPLDHDFELLLRFLGSPPKPETQDTIGKFEHRVARGDYDPLIRCPEKFSAQETVLQFDPNLARAWKRLKASFATEEYANRGGVIRRRMSEERNFRRNWDFNWKQRKARFQVLFDAFCYRWQLYGMEGDKPLLLKVTVNPTPHGTMIMIPRLWSLDCDRDLNWTVIGRLHRSHGAGRQGRKMSTNRVSMYAEAVQIVQHEIEGRASGLKGEKLTDFILRRMGKAPGTDESWIKRRRRLLPPPLPDLQ
jgi:hypothetical protein